MYTEDALRGPIADELSTKLAAFISPEPFPMPCDRWLARSLLHKACRRGEIELAWRALATLMHEHPAGVWRALTIICMEDIGVSGMDVFAAVVVAGRDKRWRNLNGGEWKVATFLVQQMCIADHDQAVCDLFHHAVGGYEHADLRSVQLDCEVGELADGLLDARRPLIDLAITSLAIGGGLAEGQRHHDPLAVLELFAERRRCWEVVDVCRAAWRITRCELALLLPLIWAAWRSSGAHVVVADDIFPPTSYVGELPGYAIDQFTRSGIQVFRRLLSADSELQSLLDATGVQKAGQHRTVGDLLFLIEGSPLSRRAHWPTGDELRLPYRSLADTMILGSSLPTALELVAARGPLIANLRRQFLPSFNR